MGALVAGCSSSPGTGSQGGTAGTGGTTGIGGGAQAGTGGTTGVGGSAPGGTGGTGGSTSGTGGTPAPSTPRCVLDLIATCSCTHNRGDAGQAEWCLKDGVTVSMTMTGSCSNATDVVMTVQQVRRADGSLCYSIEQTQSGGQFCEESDYVWKDSTGAVVANGATYASGSDVTCASTGDSCHAAGPPSSSVNLCAPTAVTHPASGPGCSAGTCP